MNWNTIHTQRPEMTTQVQLGRSASKESGTPHFVGGGCSKRFLVTASSTNQRHWVTLQDDAPICKPSIHNVTVCGMDHLDGYEIKAFNQNLDREN